MSKRNLKSPNVLSYLKV